MFVDDDIMHNYDIHTANNKNYRSRALLLENSSSCDSFYFFCFQSCLFFRTFKLKSYLCYVIKNKQTNKQKANSNNITDGSWRATWALLALHESRPKIKQYWQQKCISYDRRTYSLRSVASCTTGCFGTKQRFYLADRLDCC
jgi:hypothetical protein